MKRRFVTLLCLVALSVNALPGCMLRRPGQPLKEDLAHLRELAKQTKYDDVFQPDPPSPALNTGPPRLLTDLTPADFWPMTPEEAVQYAIENSAVLRDLGGTVLRSPDTIQTIQNPALQQLDPVVGVPSALAFFDAELSTRMFFEKNDRAVNNRIVGLGTQLFQQDFLNWDATLRKRSMTGGEYALRKTWIYDANNSPNNVFGSAWETLLDFEVRQPLLQGAGVGFNQVAGPESVPGLVNGVRIARLRTDVSLAEYRIALRDLVSNVENAYWDLYFAYRNLEAQIAARDEALRTWREFEAGVRAGTVDADVEAQARAQYFFFQEEVQIALGGRLVQTTEVNNGSSGGTFRGQGAGQGVLVAERRLRLIMGLPMNDGRVIRPAYDPKMVKVVFDWDEVLNESLTRRAELQRQRIELRRRRMELIANRNFLLPRFDAFGRYRFRGLGQMLIDSPNDTGPLFDMNGDEIDNLSFDNAYQNLTTGDFQEWQLGFEFALPVGFRRAHAAVRHAQLQLARTQAVLEEQERQIVYDLSNAYAEVVRAFEVMQTAYNRRIAALENYEALDERLKFEKDRQLNANLLLDAQRRLADAETRFYRAQVDYMLAVKNVHYEKGSLLDYNEVFVMGDEHRLPPDSPSLRNWQHGKPFSYLLTRPRQRDAKSGPATADGSPSAVVRTTDDGNVIPEDGWPMVRLPRVALPELTLPSLDNLSAPRGPTSPAQVLPTRAEMPLIPAAPPADARSASSTSSASSASSVSAAAGDGGSPAARTASRPEVSDPLAASSVEGDNLIRVPKIPQPSTDQPSRPALRLPFRSTRRESSDQSSERSEERGERVASESGGDVPARKIRVAVSSPPAAQAPVSNSPATKSDNPPASLAGGSQSGTFTPGGSQSGNSAPDYRFPAMNGSSPTTVAGRPPAGAVGANSTAPQAPARNHAAADGDGRLRVEVVGHAGRGTDSMASGAALKAPAFRVTTTPRGNPPVATGPATPLAPPVVRPAQPPRLSQPAGPPSVRPLSPTVPRPAPLATGQQPSQLRPAQAAPVRPASPLSLGSYISAAQSGPAAGQPAVRPPQAAIPQAARGPAVGAGPNQPLGQPPLSTAPHEPAAAVRPGPSVSTTTTRAVERWSLPQVRLAFGSDEETDETETVGASAWEGLGERLDLDPPPGVSPEDASVEPRPLFRLPSVQPFHAKP